MRFLGKRFLVQVREYLKSPRQKKRGGKEDYSARSYCILLSVTKATGDQFSGILYRKIPVLKGEG